MTPHESNRQRINARQAVKRALVSGDLEKEPCAWCGSEKAEAHHRNYALPLVVTWLCKRCHAKQARDKR